MGTSLLGGTKSFTVLVCRSSSVILLSADAINAVSLSLDPVAGVGLRGGCDGVRFGSGCGVFDCFPYGFVWDGPVAGFGFVWDGPVTGFGVSFGFGVCFGFAPVAGFCFDCRTCGVTVAVAGRLDLRDVCIVHSVFDGFGVGFDASGSGVGFDASGLRACGVSVAGRLDL